MKRTIKVIIGIGTLLMLLIAGLLWYISPIFKPFPQPTGPYSVGTALIELTDDNRKEVFSGKDENRRLVMRVFYPAQLSGVIEKYQYLGKKMLYYQKFVSEHYHIPECLARLFLRGIKTHSYDNAPLSNNHDTYPVILYSHGLLGLPSDTSLITLENLASHGYIVFAIDHTYLNALTLFEDGTVASSIALSNQFNKMSQKEQKEFQNQAIDVYKADMKFVIDELTKINEDQTNSMYHRMNLDTIAAMGHSAGGTASIEFCRADNRCRAAIDLDGWYDQAIGQEPLDKPLLLLFGSKSLEVSEPTPDYLKRKELTPKQYFEREKAIKEHRERLCSAPSCSFVVIQGASHSDFGDEMFIKWPLRERQAIDPYTATREINEHIIEFLKSALTRY